MSQHLTTRCHGAKTSTFAHLIHELSAVRAQGLNPPSLLVTGKSKTHTHTHKSSQALPLSHSLALLWQRNSGFNLRESRPAPAQPLLSHLFPSVSWRNVNKERVCVSSGSSFIPTEVPVSIVRLTLPPPVCLSPPGAPIPTFTNPLVTGQFQPWRQHNTTLSTRALHQLWS